MNTQTALQSATQKISQSGWRVYCYTNFWTNYFKQFLFVSGSTLVKKKPNFDINHKYDLRQLVMLHIFIDGNYIFIYCKNKTINYCRVIYTSIKPLQNYGYNDTICEIALDVLARCTVDASDLRVEDSINKLPNISWRDNFVIHE